MTEPASFEQQYKAALLEYVEKGGELALGQAYELGRQAMSEGKSLIQIASLHHEALGEILPILATKDQKDEVLQATSDFLAEALSPYEMANRGFREAIKALRRANETLEEEIKRIAYAVHDDAGQFLVAVHLALAELKLKLPSAQQERITEIDGMLNHVEKQLRRYSHELRPTILDDLGWIPAIRFLAEGVSKRANIPIHIESNCTMRLPSQAETALYRIVQEALTNATKYAQAQKILVQISREEKALKCFIQDDGVGFDVNILEPGRERKGLGMIAMKDRLNAIGGKLSIESAPGRGTKLCVELPLESE